MVQEKQIKKLQTKPITQKELQRIIKQVIAMKVFKKDSIAAQAIEIGSLEAIGLPWQEADRYLEQIKKITPEKVQAVANKYLQVKRLTTATLYPQPNKLPQ